MNKEQEDRKTARSLRRLFKASLFLPIFYTCVFSLGIVAVMIHGHDPLDKDPGRVFVFMIIVVLDQVCA